MDSGRGPINLGTQQKLTFSLPPHTWINHNVYIILFNADLGILYNCCEFLVYP